MYIVSTFKVLYSTYLYVYMCLLYSTTQSWQFSANSIHYLLGFWQRMVGSVPYIRSSEPHQLDTYVPEVLYLFCVMNEPSAEP